MEILKGICIVLLLLVLGLLTEKLFRPKADLKGCMHHLKADVCTVAVALCTKPKVRQIFDADFSDKCKCIVAPYSAVGMDIDTRQGNIAGAPCLGVQFVPNKKLDVQELQTVTDHLKIKCRRHLDINNLPWRIFAVYTAGPEYVRIYVYYEEFPEDKDAFESRYRAAVKEAVGQDFGCLRDEDLDKELNLI